MSFQIVVYRNSFLWVTQITFSCTVTNCFTTYHTTKTLDNTVHQYAVFMCSGQWGILQCFLIFYHHLQVVFLLVLLHIAVLTAFKPLSSSCIPFYFSILLLLFPNLPFLLIITPLAPFHHFLFSTFLIFPFYFMQPFLLNMSVPPSTLQVSPIIPPTSGHPLSLINFSTLP